MCAHKSSDVAVRDEGLSLSAERAAVIDVLFDDQRVWSLSPSRYALDADGARLARWPAVLRPYLDGLARISVREHLSGRVLADAEHRFGGGSGEVRIVDAEGNPLAVTKDGRLARPFGTGGPDAAGSLVDEVSKVLAVLREDCGLPAFVCYGPLLGAVREGKLIGHDNDLDVAYVSDYDHPVDVVRECLRVERAFRRRGISFERYAMGDFKVRVRDADGTMRGIDVFAGFWLDGNLCLMPFVREPVPRSAILPLGEVELEGRRFPAPADPAVLLEATYGPGWRVPDPSFHFRPPPATRRRLTGWMRGQRMQREYWNVFYQRRDVPPVPLEPSPFARWVGERDRVTAEIVDVGSGNGRDALWFARCGREVLGLDYAFPAVAGSRATAEAEGLPAAFEVLNLYDLRHVLVMGARLAIDGRARTLFGRFLIDALEDEGRRNLWRLAGMALRAGGRLYLEFRTSKDADAEHVFAGHFRRFLDPDLVVDEIEARGGRIDHREEGHGLAPFRDEDPHVCRLVVGWQR